VRYINLSWLAIGTQLLLAGPLAAQTAGAYTAPAEFMNLFFDFTGSHEPDYPAGQPTLGQMPHHRFSGRHSGLSCSAPKVECGRAGNALTAPRGAT
jgi:hypothetical protein